MESRQPVAVYYASWLPIEGFIIHFSLIEQRIQNSTRKVHWLRAGVNLDEISTNNPSVDEQTDEINAKSKNMEFKTLLYISNAVGKFIHRDDSEWVDLHAVSPELYLSIFL